MTLTGRFLLAKHWQLFLLIVGIPIIFQFIMMGSMIANIADQNEPDPSGFINFFAVFPILILICMGTFFGWFWSIGTGLQDKIPQNAKLNTRAFKIFFSIPFIYILMISATVGAKISGILETGEDGELIEKSIGVIIPLHLFSMFCIFYCLYFVSKTFKTAELQRKVSFSDFAGEFFLIWFFPIGIWIVQPKINKIAEQPTA